jgi:hypothetical protein
MTITTSQPAFVKFLPEFLPAKIILPRNLEFFLFRVFVVKIKGDMVTRISTVDALAAKILNCPCFYVTRLGILATNRTLYSGVVSRLRSVRLSTVAYKGIDSLRHKSPRKKGTWR